MTGKNLPKIISEEKDFKFLSLCEKLVCFLVYNINIKPDKLF